MSEALLSEAPPESRLASCEEQESALWSVGATLKKKFPVWNLLQDAQGAIICDRTLHPTLAGTNYCSVIFKV